MNDSDFLKRAIELAAEHSRSGVNGPFGAVVVRNGEIIAEGWNQVVSSKDPSAHAEVVAIRKACSQLDTHDLSGTILYSSCEPCPMCFSAAVWSRVDKVIFAETREGAAKAGFDDEVLYNALSDIENQKLVPCEHAPMEEATQVFNDWLTNDKKVPY